MILANTGLLGASLLARLAEFASSVFSKRPWLSNAHREQRRKILGDLNCWPSYTQYKHVPIHMWTCIHAHSHCTPKTKTTKKKKPTSFFSNNPDLAGLGKDGNLHFSWQNSEDQKSLWATDLVCALHLTPQAALSIITGFCLKDNLMISLNIKAFYTQISFQLAWRGNWEGKMGKQPVRPKGCPRGVWPP